MPDLPPMLAAPTAAGLARLAEEKRQAGRRATRGRITEFRVQVLHDLAELLDDGEVGGLAADYGITEEQAASARRAMAKVLRNRADNNGGRLGRAN